MDTDAGPYVTIPAARLAELEATIAELREKLKKANHSDPTRLKAYNDAHPEKVKERVRKWQEKNREAYNARRRELRRLKREAAAAAKSPEGVS